MKNGEMQKMTEVAYYCEECGLGWVEVNQEQLAQLKKHWTLQCPVCYRLIVGQDEVNEVKGKQ